MLEKFKHINFLTCFTGQKKRNTAVSRRALLAFTLAEVLITIGVVGIIAELTIPPLVADYQKTVYVTQLKSNYSIWNQALSQMATDSGCIDDLRCSFQVDNYHVDNYTDYLAANKTMGDKMASYFKVVKNCGLSQLGCIAPIISTTYDGSYVGPLLNNANQPWGGYKFLLANGSSALFRNFTQDCQDQGVDAGCGALVLDVNGLKGPNWLGRDIFYIPISPTPPFLGGKYKLPSSDHTCLDEPATPENGWASIDGTSCFYRILDAGWQMNY